MSTLNLALMIFLLPVAAFAILALAHRRLPRHGDFLATGSMGLALLASIVVFARALAAEEPILVHWTFDWVPTSAARALQGGVLVDGVTAFMLVVVTSVSFLVYLFSVGYMKDDVRYGRYYASLTLFSASMLGLVLADNLLYLFVFWELVGLSSYILIGHWFERKSAADAAVKAFITTRIGDVGMLIGMLICYWKVGSLAYVDLFAAVSGENLFNAGSDVDWQTWAGVGLFFGAMGKSAQFPFHVWLPDAMEGPTPVSALIHAATMVAAGVYLVGRLFPFFTPEAFLFIAYIGAITALFAATIATVQDDIKKVLAYSTLSQLGYMMLALGVGGYVAGLFHLTTHAFFKAGLFLGSGSVIHAMHHEQSMSKYGGLGKKLPLTAATYLVCVLAIIGCPPFSGFFSKDEILAAALAFAQERGEHWFLAFSGFVTAFLTAFYMFRQFFLTFTGRPRDAHAYEHAHESPWTMTVPLVTLAILALLAGGKPGWWFEKLIPPHETARTVRAYAAYHETAGGPLAPVVVQAAERLAPTEEHAPAAGDEAHAGAHGAHGLAMTLALSLAFLGVLVAAAAYWQRRDGATYLNPALIARRLRPLHTLLWNKYYFDELYGLIFVGMTLGVMRLMAAFDRIVIDGIVNFAGLFGKISAFVSGILDNWIVDGAVNGLAGLTSLSGGGLAQTATGRVRHYLLFVALGVIALSVLLFVAI